MLTGTRIVAAITAVGVAAAIALTPTSDSNAFDAHAGPKHPDISARHIR